MGLGATGCVWVRPGATHVIRSALALATGRLLEDLLVGVSGRDPLTLVAVAGVLVGTALAAALFPALREARVDPVTALRAE